MDVFLSITLRLVCMMSCCQCSDFFVDRGKIFTYTLFSCTQNHSWFRQVFFETFKGAVTFPSCAPGSVDMASAWRVSHYRWFFSNNAAVDEWILTQGAFQMNDHLQRCPFNERKECKDPVRVMLKDVAVAKKSA